MKENFGCSKKLEKLVHKDQFCGLISKRNGPFKKCIASRKVNLLSKLSWHWAHAGNSLIVSHDKNFVSNIHPFFHDNFDVKRTEAEGMKTCGVKFVQWAKFEIDSRWRLPSHLRGKILARTLSHWIYSIRLKFVFKFYNFYDIFYVKCTWSNINVNSWVKSNPF